MPPASASKPVAESTEKKYNQAITRIENAGFDLHDTDDVLAWIKTKGENSAQKVYLSALKYKILRNGQEFPKKYQDEIDRLYGKQNEKDTEQKLSDKQEENFVPYKDLMEVQKSLAKKENKTEKEWVSYVVASLYTLQPPVRLDYKDMEITTRKTEGKKNMLVWGEKDKYFLLRKYKTHKTYGDAELPLSSEMEAVLEDYFAHLGRIPSTLLGGGDLAGLIRVAFEPTGKNIGVDLLRHAYITDFYNHPRTIKEKEILATMMLHSKEVQEKYALAKELKSIKD